jgi:acyl-CoA thioesterase-1
VVLGDSLSAGYQLRASEAFPAQLEAALRARGHAISVLNAGVSGDTTAAGLDRLAWAVPADADAVIVALGANDALRGLAPALARANLDKIVGTLRAQKQDVLIAGMLAPQNLPLDYRTAFERIFPDLAARHDALLYPFFLQGVAMEAKLNLADGIHPNAAGVGVMVAGILPKAEELVARVRARRGA